jgi:hypothetical protein
VSARRVQHGLMARRAVGDGVAHSDWRRPQPN